MIKKLAAAFIAASGMLIFSAGNAAAQDAPKPEQQKQQSVKGQVSLVFETGSHHMGNRQYTDDGVRKTFNEFNPGIGIEYRLNNYVHVGAGTYYNSVRQQSVYGTVGLETNGRKFLGAGMEAGVVTGYPNHPVMPAAFPYARIGSRDSRVNVRIAVLPPVGNISSVAAAQVRIRLGKP